MSPPRGPRSPRPAPEVAGRLSPDQPVWEVEGERRLAGEGHIGEQPRAPLSEAVEPAGITVSPSSRKATSSQRVVSLRPASAAVTSAAPTSAPPITTAPARKVAAPACLSAVDDADAVISYLVANLRDQRLAMTMRQYRAASSACRRAR